MTDFIMAFVIGGLLALSAQMVLDLTRLTPAHVMVLFVVLGAVLSGIGVYQPLVEIGGAGATIPLTGFGHSLVQGIMEDVRRQGFSGIFTGGLRATAMGLSAAVVFGFLMALLFNPKN